jgi:protein-tyrosine phosphatase
MPEQPPYQLTWVTRQIAAGMAPMSYETLEWIKSQGISAILNLCAEYCDLHEIEAGEGFEVRYLPIQDECAPDLALLDGALDWLDEAVYLGKKVLVHCRHGIGRTGTVLTAYLIRRGFSPRMAEKRLKRVKAGPANFSQWWCLRRYGKAQPALTIRPPEEERRQEPDELRLLFEAYGQVLAEADRRLAARGPDQPDQPEGPGAGRCGREHDRCCQRPPRLILAEAMHLGRAMNRTLGSGERTAAIARARQAGPDDPCPLSRDGACSLFEFRPLACRLTDLGRAGAECADLADRVGSISGELAATFPGTVGTGVIGGTGGTAPARPPDFSLAEAVSGRYVQTMFELLRQARPSEAGGAE